MYRLTATECADLAFDINTIVMAALDAYEKQRGNYATPLSPEREYPWSPAARTVRLYFDRSGLIVGAFASQLTRVAYSERREWAVLWQFNKRPAMFICEDMNMRIVAHERLQRAGFARCIQMVYNSGTVYYKVDPTAQITDALGMQYVNRLMEPGDGDVDTVTVLNY